MVRQSLESRQCFGSRTLRLLILLAIAFSLACQYVDEADLQNSEVLCSETTECMDAANKAAALENYIENKACIFDFDCSAVGYGQKSCGGFAAYLPYSEQSTTTSTLDEKRDAYFTASKACNSACGLVSTCDTVSVPTISCVAGKCEATTEVPCSESTECNDAYNKATALENYIENKACTSNSDCGAVGYGHKSCGGYAAYLAYSKISTTASTLAEKSNAYFQASADCDFKCGAISTCDITAVPTVNCVVGQCVATNP